MREFLAMGGYAEYVWLAYGTTLVVMIGNLIAAWRSLQRTSARLRHRLGRVNPRR